MEYRRIDRPELPETALAASDATRQKALCLGFSLDSRA